MSPVCSPASGSTFGLGDTAVTCSATDKAGNKGTASFTIKVVDTTAPAISVPYDQTAEATSADGAKVSYSAAAKDSSTASSRLPVSRGRDPHSCWARPR